MTPTFDARSFVEEMALSDPEYLHDITTRCIDPIPATGH